MVLKLKKETIMNSWKDSQMEPTLNFAANKQLQRLKLMKNHKIKTLMKLFKHQPKRKQRAV